MNKNSTAYKLLKQLADGRFHSGQALGQSLGITRSGIWKGMQQLKQVGLEIFSLTGKGYRLAEPIELLTEPKILSVIKPEQEKLLKQLQLHTIVPSTNDLLLSLANQQPLSGIACLAEHQSQGRGRQGKQWLSQFGSCLCLSLLWSFNCDSSQLIGLSLAVGVALTNALQRYGIQQHIELKWPNDILWQQQKLAGILIDMIAEPHGTTQVVVGIGLNCYAATNSPWTSLNKIEHTTPKRNKLAGLIIDELLSMLPKFEKQGLTPYLDQWRALNTMQGQNVKLITPHETFYGILQDVSERGELILLDKHNKTRRFLSGEVSLRLE